jgi:hypothetical protein
MEFTMVPVPSGLTLSKELNEKDINAGLLDAIGNVSDYDFNFVSTSPSDTSVAFSAFTLTHKRTGDVITVTPNGTTNGKVFSTAITGINDFTYAHSFLNAAGDHAFIPGTQFSITEQTKGIFSYSKTTWTVYDAKNGFTATDYTGNGMKATFTMGTADENKSYSYAVVFNNTMNLGNLQISKVFEDTRLADTKFQFKVYLDLDGKVIGTHQGAIRYTLGQRKGLGIALGAPAYVCSKDMAANTVTLGPNEALFLRTLWAKDWNWFPFPELTEPVEVTAKIRHSQKQTQAVVYPEENGIARVEFAEPQRAITPGQAVVLYQDDMVVGGGTIILNP